MKYFNSFYAALCYSRRKKGLPIGDTPSDGNLLLALALFMLIGSTIATFAFLFPEVEQVVVTVVDGIFGKNAGRIAGKIAVFTGVFILYYLVKNVIGTDAKYQKLMSECETMSLDELKQLSRKGAKIYSLMVGSVIIPIIIWYLKSNP